MKYRNGRKNAGAWPASVDPAFAEALEGSRSSRRGERCAKQEQKAMQLCRQVQRVLNLTLAGECGDDLLRDLYVAEVLPAPDAGHLLVRVVVPDGAGMVEVLQRLERVSAKLRAEVARAITRKRAPELSFIPVAGGEAI